MSDLSADVLLSFSLNIFSNLRLSTLKRQTNRLRVAPGMRVLNRDNVIKICFQKCSRI